jgi:hypothetical protein
MSATALRKAAAVLAGLHRRDREWMLARMPSAARTGIKPLLAQFRAIGVADATLVREALDLCDKDARTPEPPTPDRLLAGMRGMSPEWKARVLAACAPDHVELYAASHPASDTQAVRNELLSLPKPLPPKFAGALTNFVRRRGEHEAPYVPSGGNG